MSLGARMQITGGDPAKVRRAMLSTEPIMEREMRRSVDILAQITANEWRRIAPVETGDYRRGIRTNTTGSGEFATAEVYNVSDHADEVERGTGVYRAGPGSHRRIRPKGGEFIYFFSARKGSLIRKRSIAGMKPMWVLRRAYSATRMYRDATLRTFARNAARDIKRKL